MTRYELNRQGVRGVEYNAETESLHIEFARGPVYEYDAVPGSIVQWLVRTKDPAGYIRRVITPGFTYRKLLPPSAPAPRDELEAQLRASLDKCGETSGSKPG